jgi:hypothetical protein
MGEGRETGLSSRAKKKTMKTKQNKNQSSGLLSRPEQLSANTDTPTQAGGQCGSHPAPADAPQQPRILPYVNYEERQRCRSLPSAEVLAHLRRWYPEAYALAEVVGAWVWVTFTEQPSENLRAGLSQIGFHWNNTRKCWQHPCGQFATEGSGADPRQKYGSRFAADQVAA